jgi:hypothetical protein
METGYSVPGWKFFLGWILLTALGYLLGFFAGFVLGHIVLSNVMIGVAIGALVCVFRRLALRRYVGRSGWWILAGIIGLFVSFGLLAIVATVWKYPFDLGWPHGALGYMAAFLVGGAIIGLMQRRVLAPRVNRANAWIWLSAIGWGSSLFGVEVFANPMSENALLNSFLLIASSLLGGIFLGVVTGAGLMWLLREPAESGQS